MPLSGVQGGRAPLFRSDEIRLNLHRSWGEHLGDWVRARAGEGQNESTAGIGTGNRSRWVIGRQGKVAGAMSCRSFGSSEVGSKSLGGSKSMSLQCADTWVKPSHHTWAGFSARADVSLCGVASMPGRMLPSAGRSAGRDEFSAAVLPLSMISSSLSSTPRDAQTPFVRSNARRPMHVAPAATAHCPPAPGESIPPILVFGPRDFPDRRVSL